MTIAELIEKWEEYHNDTFSLLGSTFQVSSYVFKQALNDVDLNNILKRKYGQREIFLSYADDSITEIDGLSNEILYYCLGVISENDYKYTTLFNSTKFEYVPLNNATLDETETITTDMQNIQEENIDVHTTTETLGAINETKTITDQKTTFESSAFTDISKSIDSNVANQVVNTTVLRDEVGGDVSKDIGTVTKVSHRQGSIGVVTNQDMLEKERKVAYFSFLNMVAFDFVKSFTYSCY